MKQLTKFLVVLLAITLLGVSCAAQNPAPAQTTPPASSQPPASEATPAAEAIVYKYVALPNDAGIMGQTAADMIEEMNIALKPFNVTVEYVAADDYAVVSESILTGTAHIGTPSGATYVKSHLENPNVVPIFTTAPLGVLEEGGYPAYIATHKDNADDFKGMSTEEALYSLKGKSFAFVSATSTSGRLVPTTSLFKIFGPEGRAEITERAQIFELTEAEGGIFSEIQYGGNHPGNIELILNGKVYAGAFCCQFAGDKFDEFYIISSETVPNGPWWVNKDFMKQEHVDALIAHFAQLTPDNAATKLFEHAEEAGDEEINMDTRFVPVGPEFYSFLEEMYADE